MVRTRLATALLALVLLAPAAAVASGNMAPVPEAATLPSFNESPGCGEPQGVRGPYATRGGDLPSSEPLWGPWADFFGRDIAEVRSSLVTMRLPSPGGDVTVYVHELVAPSLQQVIDNLEQEAARGNTYNIRRWDTWSYRAATIPPHRYLSFHAIGAAIDINSTTNPYRADNVLITDMPDWFVTAWTDAGWCWGGDWQTIKDTMHFSWKGPLATPRYQAPAPTTPRTGVANFRRTLTFPTALGTAPDDAVQLVADLDRDGAPDPVRIRPYTPAGHLAVEGAQAMHGFETCWKSFPTSHPGTPGAALILGDRTGDGRPDLWEIDGSGPALRITVYTLASNFFRRLRPRDTDIPAVPGASYLVGDHDRDGHADLYVVHPGDPTIVEVWRGPRLVEILETQVPLPTTPEWQFAMGDRDVDGIPDLYALGPGDPARVSIALGRNGFAGPVETVRTTVTGHDGTLQVGDLDGDGRDDLYFFDGDGALTVYLGGQRGLTPDSDLIYWFFEGHDRHWTYGSQCPVDPGDTFGEMAAAGIGGAAAALYRDPITGVEISGISPAGAWWSQSLAVPGIDLEALGTPAGDRFAVLKVEDGSRVALFSTRGEPAGTVRFGPLPGPVDLVPITLDGVAALGVLVDRGERASMPVRDPDGNLLTIVPLGPIAPVQAVGLDDLDGEGTPGVAVLTSLPDGGSGLVVRGVDGTLFSSRQFSLASPAEDLVAVSGPGGPAIGVLLRTTADGKARVVVIEARTGDHIATHAVPPHYEVALAGIGGDLAFAYRDPGRGFVWLDVRDAIDGDRQSRTRLITGFDPAAVTASVDVRTLVVAAHRLGDGAVLLDARNPEGDLTGRALFVAR